MELPAGEIGPDDADRLISLYHEEYRRLYGREGPDVPLETLTWRLEVVSPRPQIRLDARKDNSRALSEAHKGKREIYLPEHEDFRNVPVYDRYRLDPGAAFEGSAVFEVRESTVVLGLDSEVEIDPARNLTASWSACYQDNST